MPSRQPLPLRVMILTLASLAMLGCGAGTVLRTGGPYRDPGPNEGIRYYVARDLVVVEGTVSKRKRTAWAKLASKESRAACEPDSTRGLPDSVTYRVSTMTVPDRSRSYRLAIQPSGSTKQTVGIGVSDAGILTGINYQAENQTGEIVANVLKGVAGLAGTILGAAIAREQLPVDPKPGTPYLPSDEECFLRTPQGAAFRDIPRLAAKLDSVRDDREAVASAASRARSMIDLIVLRGRDSLLANGAQVVESRLTQRRALLAAGAAAYAKSRGVGVKVEPPSPFRFLFDLAALPSIPKPDLADAVRIPASDPRRALLDGAKLMLAVDELPADTAKPGPAAGDTASGSIGCPAVVPADRCSRIWFRLPRPRRLIVYQRNSDSTGRALTAIADTVVLLAASNDSVLHVAVSAERLGAGSLKLGFGRHGNVVSLEQTSSAAGAGAAAAFVNAISQSRTEFQAGLTAVANAQTSIIGIRQSARAARIKEIQDQKALLDSELALQGAGATGALLLQKQQLDTELALLTSQEALDAKRSPSETTHLRAEIETLKLQIELLKTLLELENVKRAAGAAPTGAP